MSLHTHDTFTPQSVPLVFDISVMFTTMHLLTRRLAWHNSHAAIPLRTSVSSRQSVSACSVVVKAGCQVTGTAN